jgi:hypothetical protein
LLARLATQADYKDFSERMRKSSYSVALSDRAAGMLADVQRDGFRIIENYWSAEECTAARAEIDRIIVEYPDKLHPNAKADRRVYGVNNVSEVLARFANDPDLTAVANAYNREPTVCAFTLGAYMPATKDNSGSGEGWHRDAFFRQIKAIVYLSDVSPENGPFQILRKSQETDKVIADMKAGNLGYMQYRMKEEEVDRIVTREPERLLTCTGKAGSLILVDTSTIHRGKPITEGVRYALTNYYFPADRVDAAMYKKFGVLGA